MPQKNGNRSFDLAVLIDSNKQYNKILCGPILYELKPRYLHFVSSKKYVTGDIDVINSAANYVQEIDTETYIKGFLRKNCDITNSFKTITTIRLFQFTDENIWINHLNCQKHTHADLLIIVNDKAHPIYVLHNTDIDFINESIKYDTCKEYQKNDVQLLDVYAKKVKTFLLHKRWKISLTKDAGKIFKTAVCYNFNDDECKNDFFNQSYDVGLITNNENQIESLICGIKYIYNENIIIFNSVIPYKNGYYNKLKSFGEQIKTININEYKLNNTDMSYKFEKDFIKNKCMLFNINNIDGWLEFISQKIISMYDIGVITNNDEYQTHFINKPIVNSMEKIISFGAVEKFMPKHHGIITKFAKLITKINLKDYIIQDFENDNINETYEIYFYEWDLHKETPDNSENEEEESKHDIPMTDMNRQKSIDSVNLKKNKKNKKKKIKMNKMRKTKSEMPCRNDPKYKNKKDKIKKDKNKNKNKNKKNKNIRKTKSEMPYSNDPKYKKHKKKKEKHRRKDSVIRPSVAKKISIINVKTSVTNKHNKNNVSELSIINSESSEPLKNKQIDIIKNNSDVANDKNIKNIKAPKSEIMINKKPILNPSPKIVTVNNVLEQKEKEKECKKVVQNEEKVVKETEKVLNEDVSVWDLYVQRFGMAPKNTYQLQNFTKICDNVKNLSYKEVRQIFVERTK